MRSQRAVDLVGSALFLALALYAGLTAAGYGLWSLGEPGSGLFPTLVSAALGLAALVGLGQALRRGPGGAPDAAPPETGRVLRYAATVTLYALAYQPVGHLVATVAAFLVLLRAVERLPWRRALWITVASAAASWLLFERLLGVPLPRGTLW